MGERMKQGFFTCLFLEIVILIQIKLCFCWLHWADLPLIYVKVTSNIEQDPLSSSCTSSEGSPQLCSGIASLFIEDKVVLQRLRLQQLLAQIKSLKMLFRYLPSDN